MAEVPLRSRVWRVSVSKGWSLGGCNWGSHDGGWVFKVIGKALREERSLGSRGLRFKRKLS